MQWLLCSLYSIKGDSSRSLRCGTDPKLKRSFLGQELCSYEFSASPTMGNVRLGWGLGGKSVKEVGHSFQELGAVLQKQSLPHSLGFLIHWGCGQEGAGQWI